MLSAAFTSFILFAHQISGSPVIKRQVSTTIVATNIATVATTPSVAVTATATVTPASPTAAVTAAGANAQLYPCLSGYNAAYAEVQMNYAFPAAVIAPYVTGFNNASYFGVINGTGNQTGATRMLASGSNEILIQDAPSAAEPSVTAASGFNLTNGPIRVGTAENGTMVSNYTTYLDLYSNDTVVPLGQVSTIHARSYFCAQDLSLGLGQQQNALEVALQNIGILLNNGSLAPAVTPTVVLTQTLMTTATAATNVILSTNTVVAPTQTVLSTLLSQMSTVTVVSSIVPVTSIATATNTVVPEASTLVSIATVTSQAPTQVVLTTEGQSAATVTALTTLANSVVSVTAQATDTVNAGATGTVSTTVTA